MGRSALNPVAASVEQHLGHLLGVVVGGYVAAPAKHDDARGRDLTGRALGLMGEQEAVVIAPGDRRTARAAAPGGRRSTGRPPDRRARPGCGSRPARARWRTAPGPAWRARARSSRRGSCRRRAGARGRARRGTRRRARSATGRPRACPAAATGSRRSPGGRAPPRRARPPAGRAPAPRPATGSRSHGSGRAVRRGRPGGS